MTHNSISRKGFAFVPVLLGAAVVAISAVVLYFGVQRVKDLQTVLQRPRAENKPSCNTDEVELSVNPYNGVAPGKDVTFSITKGDASTWIGDKWDMGAVTGSGCGCTTVDPNGDNKCGSTGCCVWPSKTCAAGTDGVHTWTHTWKKCSGSFDNCSDQCSKSISFNVGSGGGGGCWGNQPIPKNWHWSAESLNWEWDTTYSSTISYAAVYVWKDSKRTGNADAQAAASGSDLNSVKVSDFSPALAANTKYYVKVNPNGYSSPDPTKYQCMDDATRGWSFTTGSGGVAKTCSVSLDQNSITVGQPVAVTSSGTGGTVRSIISRTDSGSISGLGNVLWTDSLGHKYYVVSNPAVTGLTEGTYKVWCDIADEPNKCSGNPFCPSLDPSQCAGWARCGTNDNAGLAVAAASTCVDSQCADTSACVGNVCQPVKCPKNPSDCSGYVVSNHACQIKNSPDGTACGATGSGNTCQNGVCTVPVECDTDAKCSDDKKCTNNKCVTPACSPDPGVCQTAEYKNHACSLKSKADGTACKTDKVCSNGACVASEVNACWGNQGTNGKCYDCNGDGVVNILDFSCFQKHWLENVQ